MSTSNAEIGRFFKHSTVYALGNILNRLGAFLLLPIYTNYLLVEEYGVLELFYATTAVISGFLSVGIAHATLRFYFSYDNPRDRNEVISTNYLVSILITVTGALLIGVWHREIVQFVFGNSKYSFAMQLILVTLVLELSSQVCLAYLRAIERSTLFIAIVLVKLVLQVGANSYLVIVLKGGVEGVLTGNLIAVAAGWLALSAVTLGHCGLRFDKNKSIPVLKYSFPFMLSTITALISVNVDKFLLSKMISLEAIGIYGLALKFGLLIDQLVGEPFNRAYGAFRFSIMDRKDASEIQSSIVRYLVVGGTFCSLGLVYFVPDLLRIISDEKFWPAIHLLPLLVLAYLLRLLYYPFQTGILVEKKTKHIFYIGLAVALISVVSNFSLIYLFGVFGACVAQVIVSLALIGLTNTISQRYHKVDYEYGRQAAIVGIGVLFYALGIPVAELPLLASVAVKTILLALFVVTVLKTRMLSLDEQQMALDWIRRKVPARLMSR